MTTTTTGSPQEEWGDPAARTQLAQLADLVDGRRAELATHEDRLAAARAALRRERLADADRRAESHKLLSDARAVRREADRLRTRVRALAARYARRQRRVRAAPREALDANRRELDAARADVAADARKLAAEREALHAAAAEDRRRLQVERGDLDRATRRAAEDRAEADRYFRRLDEVRANRDANLKRREAALVAAKERADAELAARREELDGLESRVAHARLLLEDFEARRAAAEDAAPLAEELPPEGAVPLTSAADRDLVEWALELRRQEAALKQEGAALAATKAAVERTAAGIADGRRVLAERFGHLAAARARWAEAERHTVADLEELAHALQLREGELDERERRLFQADRRRREEGYELWQLRLKLEGWRGVLTAHEAWWQTEQDRADADLAARRQRVVEGEAAFSRLVVGCAAEMGRLQERLKAELDGWAASRARLDAAADAHSAAREACAAEQARHAAAVLAVEEAVRGAVAEAGVPRAGRRIDVLRRKWERAFDRRVRDVAAERAALADERRALAARFREQHRLLTEVAAREADAVRRGTELERATLRVPDSAADSPPPAFASKELDALRTEVERLAHVLMTAEWPDARLAPPPADEPGVVPLRLRAA